MGNDGPLVLGRLLTETDPTPPVTARNGAKVSLVTHPAHTSSHRLASSDESSVDATACAICLKKSAPAPASAARTAAA
ncbi:hypothetical protein BH24ACT26_BH24ACT26_03790 [soil metagenome]